MRTVWLTIWYITKTSSIALFQISIIVENGLVYIGKKANIMSQIICQIYQYSKLPKFYLIWVLIKIAMPLDVPFRYWTLKNNNIYTMRKSLINLFCEGTVQHPDD